VIGPVSQRVLSIIPYAPRSIKKKDMRACVTGKCLDNVLVRLKAKGLIGSRELSWKERHVGRMVVKNNRKVYFRIGWEEEESEPRIWRGMPR
jgi:hypothetical protein